MDRAGRVPARPTARAYPRAQARAPGADIVLFSAMALFALAMVGYPLVAALSQALGIDNRLVSVPFRMLVLALALLAFVGAPSRATPRSTLLFWGAWVVFWVLYVSRIFLDGLFAPEVLKLSVTEYFLYSVGVGLFPALAAARWAPDLASSERLLGWVIALGAAGALLNLVVIARQEGVASLLGLLSSRAKTEALNPIALGHLGVSVAVLTLWKFFTGNNLAGLRLLGLGLAFALGMVAVVASGSRGPVIIAALMIATMLWLLGLSRYLFRFLLVIAVAAAVLVYYADVIVEATSYITGRLTDAGLQDRARSTKYAEALELFLRKPFLGAGIEPLEQYPHNLILESFLVFGIVSGVAFMYLFFRALACVFAIRKSPVPGGWLYLLLVQYSAFGMVSSSLYFLSQLWVLMAVVVTFCSTSGHTQSSGVPASARFDRRRIRV